MTNFKWLLIGVLVLLGLYFVTRSEQKGHDTKTDRIFPKKTDDIYKIEMQKGKESLTLEKKDGTWHIVGNDTLQVRKDRIKSFFDQVLSVTRETLMSRKPANWHEYSVDDSTGARVKVYDAQGTLLANAIFGRSTSDWARNYVRVGDKPEVYLTDRSVLYQVHPSPTYWGEKPKPPKPDSTKAAAPGGAPMISHSAPPGSSMMITKSPPTKTGNLKLSAPSPEKPKGLKVTPAPSAKTDSTTQK